MTDIQPKTGLTQDTVQTVNQVLRRNLANFHVVYMRVKQFHWNVRGPHFSDYHGRFDEMAAEILPVIDDTAEKIRALGLDSPGSMQEFINLATLKETPSQDISAKDMITALLADYEQMIQEVRKDITTCEEAGDAGNADFLTGLIQQFEKTAWMLRATIS